MLAWALNLGFAASGVAAPVESSVGTGVPGGGRTYGQELSRKELMRLFGVTEEVAEEVVESVELTEADVPAVETFRDLADLTGTLASVTQSAEALSARLEQIVQMERQARADRIREQDLAAQEAALLLLLL